MCRCGSASVVQSAGRLDPVAAPHSDAAGHDVTMKYLGHTALLLKGPVSRRIYALRPGRLDVQIDARDADALLVSRLFERATLQIADREIEDSGMVAD